MRYCVQPAPGGEAEPIKAFQLGESLMDRAESAGWAHAGQGTFEGQGGETLEGSLLSVRVGTAWSPYEDGEESAAPADATDVAQRRSVEAAKGQLTAGRQEILEGPEGLGAILESGQFEVAGTVYFRPLRPFEPDPEMPENNDRFLARHQFEYVYPRDKRD